MYPDFTYRITRLLNGASRIYAVTGKLTKALELVQPWIGIVERILIVNEDTGLQEFDWVHPAALVVR